MTYYVMLIVTLVNGQVTGYKPAAEDLYRFKSECQNQIPAFIMNHPEYRNLETQIICADVQRP